ncbi:hypothetical protein [Streptomyces zaehneri]|uniref:hypothetical protein n=1 Tax=Streptomyces zaehneri TaxID=3051180 RepID=UPI0028D516AC|nr:hypothetical protein [Streptomyces sp. DSM 40713]
MPLSVRPPAPLPPMVTRLQPAPAPARREPLGRPAPPFTPQDASACDIAAIEYQKEAELFEAALARYIIYRRSDVTAQMRTVACAAWNMARTIDPARTTTFAETNAAQPGAVGSDPGALWRVACSGNVRETVAFLLAGQRAGAFNGLSDFRFLTSLDPQRAKRVKQPVELQRRMAQDVHPPLSADETRFASRSTMNGDRFVEWCRGEQFLSLPASDSSHQNAEPTGGLVGTGLSGSTMTLLEIARLAQDQGVRNIDLELVRLAAIAVFVEHGHHTVHECLTSAQMWAAHTNAGNKLTYDNDYLRYRSIAPLTERELRGVARSARFPDESMNETAPAASAANHPVPAGHSVLRQTRQHVPVAYRGNESGHAGVRR